MPEILLVTVIAAAVDECFELALSVDAHTASMGTSREIAVAGVTSGAMSLGETVTWEARHFGLPFRMTSKITAYDRPHGFVDEQSRGPFAMWWHEHQFKGTHEGTAMTDFVRYASPLGPVGRLADRLVLQRYLTRLLEQRNTWLKRELETR